MIDRETSRILILGAAGRDFHNFNTLYRDDPAVRVVAFTATQIPGIDSRTYPPELAGPLYPAGVPILSADGLEEIIREQAVGAVMFAYSDVTHEEVMHIASRALATGADFLLAGPDRTMLPAACPVVAVSAVRTGCGKSQVARHVARHLRSRGNRIAVLRHPMPYGELGRQAVQRFASLADLDAAQCSIEEREEYEPHIAAGGIVFAGVDYARIVEAAASEADIIVWDGGNNDFPFLCPDLHIVVTDALRPEQLTTHHPGEAVLRMADIVVINKVDSADAATVDRMASAIEGIVPGRPIVRAASPVRLDDENAVRGRKVLVVEDGPTLTHGGVAEGAGAAAVRRLPGTVMVDPRASAAPEIAALYRAYPHVGPVLPAMGYSAEQRAALTATINASHADLVVAATPVDLGAILAIDKPVVRAFYDYADSDGEKLAGLVDQWADRRRTGPKGS